MSVREADERETGSANFFARTRPAATSLATTPAGRPGKRPGAPRQSSTVPRGMHLRPPVLSHGFTSFLWGLGLGLYVWIFLAAADILGPGTAFLLGLVSGIGVFFLVLRLGGEHYRESRES